MRRRLALLPLLLALAGCGAEPGPGDIAEDYVGSTNPDKCEDVDLRFLERLTERRGEAARNACRDATMRFRPPSDVTVERETITGDRADVRIKAAGQRLSVKLERRDGRWLVTGLGS